MVQQGAAAALGAGWLLPEEPLQGKGLGTCTFEKKEGFSGTIQIHQDMWMQAAEMGTSRKGIE